jgi:DNA-binding LacI/PurR family transcriptional regulator
MSLKELAEHLELSPATVSLVINRLSVADSIPQETKHRIFAAARKALSAARQRMAARCAMVRGR